MVKCVQLVDKKTQVCAGSLNKLITLETRSITPPLSGTVDLGESFSTVINCYAMVVQTRGEQIFNGVDIVGIATHDWYIRYIPNVTFENWIKYSWDGKTQYFRILDVINYEEKGIFYQFKCEKRGDVELPANWA
jgi:hypothetical protein